MQLQIVRAPVDARGQELLEQNFRLRHKIFVETEGWEALRRPDGRDIDAFDNEDAAHLLITDAMGKVVGGSRITPLDRPNLLQTVFNGLVQGEFPAHPSLGADWTRFYVHPDRRDGRRRAPESAALFCAVMEFALLQGLSFITFVSSLAMIEHGTAVGWRITPLGAPVMDEGKPIIAAWIDISEQALDNVRRKTGIKQSLLHGPAALWRQPGHRPLQL